MKTMRKISKFAVIFLVFHMLMLSGLSQSVWAAMISTESIMHINRGQSPHDYFDNLLAREDIQAVLESHGIDPQEAQARINHLSGNEIDKLLHEIDKLPAGGGGTAGVVTLIIMFLIAVVADLFYNDPAPDD